MKSNNFEKKIIKNLDKIRFNDFRTIKKGFENGIANSTLPSYLYTYPLRQSYRPLKIIDNQEYIETVINQTPDNLNLYIHFPFCKQICSYCNLYAVAGGKESQLDQYIDAVEIEIRYYASILKTSKIRTLYLGGGTPSLMSTKQIERVLKIVRLYFPNFESDCEEICIEVDPNTIYRSKVKEMKSLGINRINLGVQSFSNDELKGIGRNYKAKVCIDAIEAIKGVGIENLCIDLINGLLDQSIDAWIESIQNTLKFEPETICIYSLVVRPSTGFYKMINKLIDSEEIYHRYDLASNNIIEKGFEQETNVRFAIPNKGGYKQIEFHWEGATILGIGAGARTYAPEIHFRNGYSAKFRNRTLQRYYKNIKEKNHARIDGYVLSKEEQIRREFILNLHKIEINKFDEKFNTNFYDYFPAYINYLKDHDFLKIKDNNFIKFTSKGFKYRDLISSYFISQNVGRLSSEYDYND